MTSTFFTFVILMVDSDSTVDRTDFLMIVTF